VLRRRARHGHADPAGVGTSRRLLPFAALLALVFPAGASAARSTETAEAGDVHAELSYEKVSEVEYRDVRLKIVRAGVTALDAEVPAPCRECPTIPAASDIRKSLVVQDLDGDSEPEVLVDLFTGGAHCCTFTQIYAWRDSDITYVRTKHAWRDSGYTLRDLDGDGKPELHSYDARFAYEFTAYAFSVFPVQIWRFRDGHVTNVTRRFRDELRRDARMNKKLYRRTRDNRDADIRGVLAAYLADKYLLGQGRSGWRLVRRAVERGEVRKFGRFDSNPAGRAYLRRLRRFLKSTGYNP
jgi:hypothetical protein